jgi:hypothetical protein
VHTYQFDDSKSSEQTKIFRNFTDFFDPNKKFMFSAIYIFGKINDKKQRNEHEFKSF